MPLAAATPPAATAGAGSAAVRLPGPWSLGATAGWLLMAFVAYASISIAAGALYRVLASYGVVQSFAFATGAGFLLTVDIAAECAAFAVVVLAVHAANNLLMLALIALL